MGHGTLGRSGTGQRTIGKIRDVSGNPPGCPGRVGGPLGRFEMGRGNLPDVQDGSKDPQ